MKTKRTIGPVAAATLVAGAVLIAGLLAFAATACAQQIKLNKHNYLAASGQWKTEPEPEIVSAEESPKVQIECDKNISLCAVAEGASAQGDGNLFTRLDVSPVHYNVLRWDSVALVAETSARVCVNARLVIDLRAKTVTMIETPKGGEDDNEFCRVYSHTVTSRLVSSGG